MLKSIAISIVLSVISGPLFANCIQINAIVVQGSTLIDDAQISKITEPYQNKCLGLLDFDTVLEALTEIYIENGYILSRAYLREQDLSDGTLEIRVVEGRVSRIFINGEINKDWINRFFPKIHGQVAQIRDVEQGLDQIQNMRNWTAKMSFSPDDMPGESVLSVEATSKKPVVFEASSSNSDLGKLGSWNSTVTATFTDLVGRGETVKITTSQNAFNDPIDFRTDQDISRASSIEYTIPHGRTTYTISGNWSDYVSIISGSATDIRTNGWARSWHGEVKHLLYRDQKTKVHGVGRISQKTNRNYIENTFIENSSRSLSNIELGVAFSTKHDDVQYEASAFIDNGTLFFGAEDVDQMPEGSPNAQHSKVYFDASREQSFEFSHAKLNWHLSGELQLSNDRLYGDEIFSLSGSKIRGAKVPVAIGSSGLQIKNDFDVSLSNGASRYFNPELTFGFDYGSVFPQSSLRISKSEAIGSSVGLKFKLAQGEIHLKREALLYASNSTIQTAPIFKLDLKYEF